MNAEVSNLTSLSYIYQKLNQTESPIFVILFFVSDGNPFWLLFLLLQADTRLPTIVTPISHFL